MTATKDRPSAKADLHVDIQPFGPSTSDLEGIGSDEAFTWSMVQPPFTAMFRRIVNDIHPPLYYVLLGKALKAVGDWPLVPRLAVLRVISYLLAFAGFALGLFATWKHLEIRRHPAASATLRA